jgi:lipoate-protein ligase A
LKVVANVKQPEHFFIWLETPSIFIGKNQNPWRVVIMRDKTHSDKFGEEVWWNCLTTMVTYNFTVFMPRDGY